MKTDIDKVISTYQNRYYQIFNNYYPAHNNTGFTERNLSVNFACAMEQTENSTFTWYEAPTGVNAKEHFDAIVFNEEKKEMFIIESKRFTSPSQKLASMGRDLQRMTNASNIKMVCEGLYNISFDELKIYGIVLADLWLETKEKRKILEQWNENLFNYYSENLSLSREIEQKLKNTKWYPISFKPKREADQWRNNYKLLVLVAEITNVT